MIAAASITALELLSKSSELRKQLNLNAEHFRSLMNQAGFDLLPGSHPIVPVMFGEAVIAKKVAEKMLSEEIFVTAFSYPVVPLGKARIRVQLSAIHTFADIEKCVSAFVRAREGI